MQHTLCYATVYLHTVYTVCKYVSTCADSAVVQCSMTLTVMCAYIHTVQRRISCFVCMHACACACVRVCVSPVQVRTYAVDSIYQPLTVAWDGVLLVWQPLPLPFLLQLRSLVLLTHLPFIVFSFNRQLLALQTHAHTHAQCKGDEDATYVYTHW